MARHLVRGGGYRRRAAPDRTLGAAGRGWRGGDSGIGGRRVSPRAQLPRSETSAVGTDPLLSPQQRRAGLPADPGAGLTSPTAAGPVQVVLPGGLGPAQHSAGGQVVYPNAGAGFDMLAENTGTGTRTVARINGPAGPRMVTTFVRTPADTVMLAHTNGYLTINRATPTAETIGMFSPAETRDAAGALVPELVCGQATRPAVVCVGRDLRPSTGHDVAGVCRPAAAPCPTRRGRTSRRAIRFGHQRGQLGREHGDLGGLHRDVGHRLRSESCRHFRQRKPARIGHARRRRRPGADRRGRTRQRGHDRLGHSQPGQRQC